MKRRADGQALVEFAIAVSLFLVFAMGIFDFGMAIYKYNGVSQAAREIARVASVHPGDLSGSDPAIVAVVAIQKRLIPGLTDPTFSCVDSSGVTVTTECDYSKDSVRVTISAPYTPVTPLLGLVGTWTMNGTSSAQIQ